MCTKLKETEGMGLAEIEFLTMESKDHRQQGPNIKFIMSVIALVNLTFNRLLCRWQELSLHYSSGFIIVHLFACIF